MLFGKSGMEFFKKNFEIKLFAVVVGVGVAVGDGDGVGDVVGVAIGVGDLAGTPLFQINFLPDLMQVNFLPFEVAVRPAF